MPEDIGTDDSNRVVSSHIMLWGGRKIPWDWKLFEVYSVAVIVLGCLNLLNYYYNIVMGIQVIVTEVPFQRTFELVLALLLFIELCARIFEPDVPNERKGRYIFNAVDIIVFVLWIFSLLVAYLPELHIYLPFFMLVRAIRLLRIIYVFRKQPGVELILKVLSNSINLLFLVGLVIFTVIIYLSTFTYMTYNRYDGEVICLRDSEWNNLPQKFQMEYESCSAYALKSGYYCLKNTTLCETWIKDDILKFDMPDTPLQSIFFIFQLITLEGWSSIADSLEYKFHTVTNWPFLIVIILFGSMYALNLIIGVIVTIYRKEKQVFDLKSNNICDVNNRRAVRNHASIENDAEYDNSSQFESNDFNNVNYRHFGNIVNELENLINNFWFKNSIYVFILLNTIVLSFKSDKHESVSLSETLCYMELLFVILFVIEITIKIIVLRSGYFLSILNRCDFIVTALSVLLFMVYGSSFGLTAFRLIHFLTALRYTRFSETYENFTYSIKNSLNFTIGPLVLIYSILLIIFATVGIQVFAYREIMKPTSLLVVSKSFYSLTTAIITTFQIMSGENWTILMYQFVGGFKLYEYFEPYFVIVVITGKYILLNILLAIAVDIMTTTFYRKYNSNQGDPMRSVEMNGANRDHNDLENDTNTDNATSHSVEDDLEQNNLDRPPFLPYRTLYIFSRTNSLRKSAHLIVNHRNFESFVMYAVAFNLICHTLLLTSEFKILLDQPFLVLYTIEFLLKIIDVGFVLHPGSYLRNFWNVVDFMTVVTVPILYAQFIYYIYFNRPTPDKFPSIPRYFMQQLFVRVAISVRALKLLRLLKLSEKKNRSMKHINHSVIKCFKYLPLLLIIYFTYFLIYSIISVHLFSGRILICETQLATNIEDCKIDTDYVEMEEVDNEGKTINPYGTSDNETKRLSYSLQSAFHFDNIFESMITLFAIQNGQEWNKISEYAVKVHPFTQKLVDDGSLSEFFNSAIIFYFTYLVVFSFLFTRLFSGLVIATYCEEKTKLLGKYNLDKNQADCIGYVLDMKSHRKFIPSSRLGVRRKAWDIVNSKNFEIAMFVIIFLNGLLFFIIDVRDETSLMIYFVLSTVFTIIYICEFVLKMAAYKYRHYFSSWWNYLDFFIFFLNVIDLIIIIPIAVTTTSVVFNVLAKDAFVQNFFKTLHLFKLVKYIKSTYIKRVLFACKKSFLSLHHVLLPFVILLLIYCFFALQILNCFNIEAYNISGDGSITSTFNFFDIYGTLLLLIRTASGEPWLWAMHHSSLIHSCYHYFYGFGKCFTYFYFISFVFLSTHLLVNLFPAMIVDNFRNLVFDNSVLGEHHLNEFVTSWVEYDPKATRKIHFQEFFELLKKISPPLGLGTFCPNRVAYRKLMKLHIPVGVDGKIGYKVSLFALIRESLNIKNGKYTVSERKQIDIELHKILVRLWPSCYHSEIQLAVPDIRDDELTIAKIYAGRMILDYWRRHRTIQLN